MISCKDITELITDYVEGVMPFTDRMSFRMHIAMCPPCKRYVEQMKLTVETTGQLPSEPLPEHVESELMTIFKDWKTGADS
jgi:anti-sigma factor RsiW